MTAGAQRAALVAEDLGCVRVADLGCHDPADCWARGHCAFSRDDSKPMRLKETRERRGRRLVDKAAIRRKMRVERSCRCGCGGPAEDAHHLFPRGLGGDDVEDNIVGLAHFCHMAYEFDVDGRAEVGALIGAALTDAEVGYVLRKRGESQGREFLRRYYRREVE